MVRIWFLTIFAVHFFNFPDKCAVLDNIIVKFIQGPNCRQLRTRELAQWVQIKIIEAFANTIQCEYHHSRPNQASEWPLRSGNELKHD